MKMLPQFCDGLDYVQSNFRVNRVDPEGIIPSIAIQGESKSITVENSLQDSKERDSGRTSINSLTRHTKFYRDFHTTQQSLSMPKPLILQQYRLPMSTNFVTAKKNVIK